jgi:hypothetical protein
MKIAPEVAFTRLPHGGAVLVNRATLALIECGESDAALIERLLTHGLRAKETAELRRLAEQMIESGWLLADGRS